MQVTGMRYGKQILDIADFPTPKVLTSDATLEEIELLMEEYNKCVVKPIFYGGVGKKGKAGLVQIVNSGTEALNAKRKLYFAQHFFHDRLIQANGVTFEEFVPSSYEIYFNLSVSTISRKVNFTLTHHGGVDIEELGPDKLYEGTFDALTGLKTYHIVDALTELNAPREIISPLAQHLPKLWNLYNDFGFIMLEINPIRMKNVNGRLVPYACDFKAQFDRDNKQYKRLNLPPEIFATEMTPFEDEINQLRTYQGQSDVVVINPFGTVTSFMFGGGANSAATEILSEKATISSDFGGNPPYEKMYEIARIVLKYWLKQSNVLLIIGGKANNTDIFITFKAIFDALRDYISQNGKPDVYVVVGRGGPNLIKGMSYARDILDNFSIPYKFFGYDSSMVEVVQYASDLDSWIKEQKASATNVGGENE
jgi:succinyl-CoA synthetase beta subunit